MQTSCSVCIPANRARSATRYSELIETLILARTNLSLIKKEALAAQTVPIKTLSAYPTVFNFLFAYFGGEAFRDKNISRISYFRHRNRQVPTKV